MWKLHIVSQCFIASPNLMLLHWNISKQSGGWLCFHSGGRGWGWGWGINRTPKQFQYIWCTLWWINHIYTHTHTVLVIEQRNECGIKCLHVIASASAENYHKIALSLEAKDDNTHTPTCACMHTHKHMCTHTHIHAHTHIYTHAYTHIYC